MEVPSSEVVSKPPKLLFFGCIKMKPATYVQHCGIFALLTSFAGLVFLAVVDMCGWFDGKPGTFWYVYLLKISISLILIALGVCLVSLVIATTMQKHLKCLKIFLSVMLLLNVVAILSIAVMSVVRLEGSWLNVYGYIRNRMSIYGGWILSVVCVVSFFTKGLTDEEFGRKEDLLEMSNLPA